eukprot:jgi/Chlat1/3764/Chrsp259S03906
MRRAMQVLALRWPRLSMTPLLSPSLQPSSLSSPSPQHQNKRPRISFERTHASICDSNSNAPAVIKPNGNSAPSKHFTLPMDVDVHQAVQRIDNAGTKVVIVATGGAAQALSWLMAVPGASNVLLEASVPYTQTSLIETIGKEPEQSVSASTARDLARAAYLRALHLTPPGTVVAGLGCTCALATTRPKRGRHRCCIASHNGKEIREYTLVLRKEARQRFQEDAVASRLLLQALAEACGLRDVHISLGLLGKSDVVDSDGEDSEEEEERVVRSIHAVDDPIDALMKGEVSLVQFEFPSGIVNLDAARGRVFLPGSFNPLHHGHTKLLAAAAKAAECPPSMACCEISAVNADKPAISAEEARKRVAQFREAGISVVLTNAPRFVDKAALIRDSTFVVGVDTAARLVQPKFYGDSEAGMIKALADLYKLNCRFLVAGRQVEGKFLELKDITIPPGFDFMFKDIPATDFREDISSTEIRNRMQQP